jgi:hypothetical protein
MQKPLYHKGLLGSPNGIRICCPSSITVAPDRKRSYFIEGFSPLPRCVSGLVATHRAGYGCDLVAVSAPGLRLSPVGRLPRMRLGYSADFEALGGAPGARVAPRTARTRRRAHSAREAPKATRCAAAIMSFDVCSRSPRADRRPVQRRLL